MLSCNAKKEKCVIDPSDWIPLGNILRDSGGVDILGECTGVIVLT